MCSQDNNEICDKNVSIKITLQQKLYCSYQTHADKYGVDEDDDDGDDNDDDSNDNKTKSS